MTLLALEKVVAGYRHPVVGPVSLTVKIGEVVGLGGSNGCGKSTLLKCLSGEAKVFSGHIHRAPGLRLSVQKQHPPRLFGFPLNVREYLRLMEADRQPLPERLSGFSGLRLDSLSGGQFQLLCVWACLASPARLVLLDEPTNNLDPAGVRLLRHLLENRRPEQAVVLISHEQSFMDAITTRGVDLNPLHTPEF